LSVLQGTIFPLFMNISTSKNLVIWKKRGIVSVLYLFLVYVCISMQSNATSVQEYLDLAPVEQAEYVQKIRETVNKYVPDGFEECINYGYIGRVVPHSIYPPGYHCNPELPLPFLNLAYQKKSINFYHMWIYAQPDLLERFQNERSTRELWKLDMWKSCIRFKKYEKIPYGLLGELVAKMDVQDWIDLYENNIKR